MKLDEPLRDDGLTQEQYGFLQFYAAFKFIRRACKHSGIDRATHNRWLQTSDAYKEAYKLINDDLNDLLEQAAMKRAVLGVNDLQLYKGKPIRDPNYPNDPTKFLYKKVYSDSLLAKLLEANNPDKFKTRTATEISGPGGGPVFNVIEEAYDGGLGDPADEITAPVETESSDEDA